MGEIQRVSHVAETLPRDYFDPAERTELLSFYDAVFGWLENERTWV